MTAPVALIAAQTMEGGIGIDGQLPFVCQPDMTRFRRLTQGHTVIMGRKTFESLGWKPLPRRRNVVLTRDYDTAVRVLEAGGFPYPELDIALASEAHQFRIRWVIGGAQVYWQALSRADRIELTTVRSMHACDSYFPEMDPSEWRLTDLWAPPAGQCVFQSFRRLHT